MAGTVFLSDTTLTYGDPNANNGLGGIDMNNFVLPNMGNAVNLTDSANLNTVRNEINLAPYFSQLELAMIAASNLPTQLPSAQDTPQNVFFGPPQITSNVELTFNNPSDPEGSILTFQPGVYFAQVKVVAGRSASQGSANLGLQVFVGGSAIPNGLFVIRITDDAARIDFPLPSIVIYFASPTTVHFELARLSLPSPSNNDGGLYAFNPTSVIPAWSPTPSAIIRLDKFSS